MNITPRVGFCCKYQTDDKLLQSAMNQRSTTLTALRKMSRSDQHEKLLGIAQHNVEALMRQLKWIAEQPVEMRMFRIGSDFLPAYVTPDLRWVYDEPDVKRVVEDGLKAVRPFAELHGIRLSTHPGQFTTLCTQKPDVLERSIEDLDYHAYLAASMGYGGEWHGLGYAINIHANDNLDPNLAQMKSTIQKRLSPELRNLLTIENDEFGCSVDGMISARLYEVVALVMDIHHHWIQSLGQYIQPSDPRIEFFKESWRGSRPLGHFSTSSEELLQGACSISQPDLKILGEAGHRPSKLRAHSFGCWNDASNDWALSHLVWTDLEVEAKGKQIASRQLYDRGVSQGIIQPSR
jgi:UV DNA damage repair endonuclease